MYCPECGTRLDDEVLFCPECGTKVERSEETVSSTPTPEPMPDAATRPVYAHGLILTNIHTLSQRLKIDGMALRGIIERYIEQLYSVGLSYRLIDASDYRYERTNLLGQHKQVHLDARSAWYEYADLLLDQHEWEQKNGMPESDYVFIIGGNHDVPMPRLKNFLAAQNSGNDKTMDTDLLYAYPYGEKMEEDLLTQRLFRYDALFYVGRLPIADDGVLSDLVNYLNRSAAAGCGVQPGYAYAQCDPHWKGITDVITDPILQSGLFYAIDKPEQLVYDRHIHLTPYIVLDGSDMQPLFDPEAAYLFFNMHGGDGLNSYHYYGAALEGGGCKPGFSPRLVQCSERPNILFTQACYGGRFIGYPKHLSMVLSALSAQTMCFIGSSRTAWGGTDYSGALSSSDVLARSFNQSILTGMSAGAAFHQARMDTFRNAPGDPTHALTIAEFNLFGDPMTHFAFEGGQFVTDKTAPLRPEDKLVVPTDEVLMSKSADEPQSMLSQLRAAVDANIMAIHKVVSEQLYKQYNIPPREPAIITRRTYPDGKQQLAYTYLLDEQSVPESAESRMEVTADKQGNVATILMTK